MPNLPDSHKRAWVYLGMFPNTVIAFYPESMMFYQVFPVQPGLTLQPGASYRYRDETRQMRLARYLSTRLDRDTQQEDAQLTHRSCDPAKSHVFPGRLLSHRQSCVSVKNGAVM